MDRSFEFDFDPRFKPIALLYGATEGRSEVVITGDGRLTARFGFVRIDTPLDNIVTAEKTGPYHWWKAIGVRTSFADKGLTFGSTAAGGVCLRFRSAIASKPGLGGVRHPGLTLTVKDRDEFLSALAL